MHQAGTNSSAFNSQPEVQMAQSSPEWMMDGIAMHACEPGAGPACVEAMLLAR